MPQCDKCRAVDEIQEIKRLLEKQQEATVWHHERVIGHISQCEMQWRRVDSLELDIEGRPGNGHNPGLKTRVATTEKGVENLAKESGLRHQRVMRGLWTIGSGLLLAIITVALDWITGG